MAWRGAPESLLCTLPNVQLVGKMNAMQALEFGSLEGRTACRSNMSLQHAILRAHWASD